LTSSRNRFILISFYHIFQRRYDVQAWISRTRFRDRESR
jgi:hypothetical protein